jgi:homoprotocatechuate degradation regulator HpaR
MLISSMSSVKSLTKSLRCNSESTIDQIMKTDFKPRSTRRSLPMALLRARENVMECFRPLLARHDVTEQQWRVIRVLAEAGQMDATEVADRASILAPSLTRIIKNLELKKLVKRERDAKDGRRVMLRITQPGLKLMAQALPETSAIHAEIETKIGKEKLNKLLDMLEEMKDLKPL